jgi:amidase
MNALTRLSGTEMVRRVAAGDVSAVDLVTAHLAEIERQNPHLNAFVEVCAESAVATASAQDEAAARGRPRGPLGGHPVSIYSAVEV